MSGGRGASTCDVEQQEPYDAYLARVRAQEARDRDRWTGADSHEGEPLYDLRDGDTEAHARWRQEFQAAYERGEFVDWWCG